MAEKRSAPRRRAKVAASAPEVPAGESVFQEAGPSPSYPERKRTSKQAVVIVHGMGEQKPLETLRSFVHAVWGGEPIPKETPTPDDVWLVPDNRAGLKELARITTRENAKGVRTDFYELYWSDLMVGNTFSQLRGWVTGLLWRWPHQVPKETFRIWLFLWTALAVGIVLASYVGFKPHETLTNAFKQYSPVPTVAAALLSVALGAIVGWLLSQRLRYMLELGRNRAEAFFGIWAMQTPQSASMNILYSSLAIIVLSLAATFLSYWYFPWAILAYPRIWAALALVAILLLPAIVVPVFGDVARYVSTSPDSVAARSEIRDRGLRLLRELHGASEEPNSVRADYDPGDHRDYDRIVMVGHSLGSIVAYDILRLLWDELGPNARNVPSKAGREALERLDAYLVDCSPDERPTDGYKRDWDVNLHRLRNMQHAVASELGARERGWRITDFITLGSPLTHAEFLVSRDRSAFEERKAERMFPTCPPMMEPHSDVKQYSFLFKDKDGNRLPHHAAVFAATRWTNIYDPSDWLLNGDFISGPCQPNFGPGIMDLPVMIQKDAMFKRLVTHTHYWDHDAGGLSSEETLGQLGLVPDSGARQDHLALLRAAAALR